MYWLTYFGATALPQYDVTFSGAPAPAPARTVGLVGGGVYDADGSGVAMQRYPYTLRYDCMVASAAAATAFAGVQSLKTLLGQRRKLWRTPVEAVGAPDQWAWARLVDVDDRMRTRGLLWHVPVALEFAMLGPWNGSGHGPAWTLDDGELLDDGLALDMAETTQLSTAYTAPQTVVVTNNGNRAVRDVVLTLTSAGSANTYLAVSVAGVSKFSWSGTLPAGKSLVIDTARRSILNDGANAYNGFTLEAEHVIADWLVLEPGANNVVVRTTSGGPNSTITFEFADGWM